MTSTTVDLDDLLNSPPVPIASVVHAPVVHTTPTSPSRRVQTKDEQVEGARREEAQKREQRERAAAELATWQEQRHRNLQTVRDAHRVHAAHAVEPTGHLWEKVASLVEAIPASSTGKDISKFRSTLLSLRSSPPA